MGGLIHARAMNLLALSGFAAFGRDQLCLRLGDESPRGAIAIPK